MSKRSHKALASATVMSLILTSTLTATNVQAATEVTRMPGVDRFSTAQEVAKQVFGKAETVVLVNGLGYADAVSATPLAKAYNAPILLTNDAEKPSSELVATLASLGAKKVVIVGGTGVVKDSLKDELAKTYTVERIAGSSRYETNANVAKEVLKLTKATKGVLVSAAGYADALSVASIAAAKGMPVLFGNAAEVPAVVKEAANGLELVAVGGTGVLPDAVLQSVKATRIANGADRFETNLKVLEYFKGDLKDVNNIFMAAGGRSGDKNFADALVASAAAAKYGAPVVLTGLGANQAQKDSSVKYVVDNIKADMKVTIVGGTAAVGSDIEAALKGETAELTVESASAINSMTLNITGTGLGKLKAEDITISANKVTTLVAAADGKSATATLEGRLAPDKDTAVSIKVGDQTKELIVKYKTEISKVTLNETTFDDDRASQKLTFKVNNESVDADVDYLALAGYTVNFVATDKDDNAANIFVGGTNVSTDGKLIAPLLVGEYNIQVQLLKTGVATIADTGKIKVVNLDGEVASLGEIKFANGAKANVEYYSDDSDSNDLTGAAYKMNSTTLVAGEKANVFRVKATVGGEEITVPFTDIELKSSNPAVLSVDPTNQELTANSKGTAVITVKAGNKTKDITFTVVNDARKIATVKADTSSVKAVKGNNFDVEFTTLDQYGDPFTVVTGDASTNSVVEIIPQDSTGADLVAGFEVTTDTVNSLGVHTMTLNAAQAGRGTVYFKNTDGKVLGSMYVDITENGSVSSKKLEVVESSTTSKDNTLELTDSKDNTVVYKFAQYNPNGVFVSDATFDSTPTAGEFKVVSADTSIATVAYNDGDKTFTVTAVKKGNTDIILKDNNGGIVAKTTITVTNNPYEIKGITFKTVGTIDYAGKQIFAKDVLDLTKSNSDDIVNGVTLSKSTSSKVRIAETAAAGISVDELYLDLDNNGSASTGDVSLGTLSAVAASDVNGTFTVSAYGSGYVANGLLGATTASGDKGTVIIKIMEDPTDATTSITGTSFYVNVK